MGTRAENADEYGQIMFNTGHRAALMKVGMIFDRGTGSDGWDIGLMEDVWAFLNAQDLIEKCPVCREERTAHVYAPDECPFAEWHPRHDLPDDDEDDDDEDPD